LTKLDKIEKIVHIVHVALKSMNLHIGLAVMRCRIPSM
jgi:hypothetical protein